MFREALWYLFVVVVVVFCVCHQNDDGVVLSLFIDSNWAAVYS